MFIRMAKRVQCSCRTPNWWLWENSTRSSLVARRQRIRMVARGQTPGFLLALDGPGTGKTHTVLAVLKEMGGERHYHRGHITAGRPPGGSCTEHSDDGIIALDDVGAIFGDKKAVQLLAGGARAASRATPLPMGYSSARGKPRPLRVPPAASSASATLPSTNKGMLAALRSRVHTLATLPIRPHAYRPVPATAFARRAGQPKTSQAFGLRKRTRSSIGCGQNPKRLKVPVDLRVLLDKALPDYLAWRRR